MRFCCPWEQVDGFVSLAEFRSFERWMLGQVSGGLARQVPVADPYRHDGRDAGLIPAEVWYLHLQSREVWRLVWPEPPFDGLFVRVP
ncbi:hypothetical protein AB595_00680 [Massilia sp. WF1]|uniref:hypothetical protein n=1 Tax=unclassified Massilia TaxID=2609279 RepID=UPI00064B3E79|nr:MULTISPECIES: hypothetical protein [unclassified Massilia]ALK95000.1 hypothetical protein AM586_00550 [Massilia sp. WG5]KLU38418.1 hypothetical protein AB595_00680 [Massilia sp. WF1]